MMVGRLAGLAAAIALLAVVGGTPAQAEYSGENGPMAFVRFNDSGERILISNRSGTEKHKLSLPWPAFWPTWSPDGTKLLVTVFDPNVGVRPAIVNPDTSQPRVLDVPQVPAELEIVCQAWSPNGNRLLCQAIRFDGDSSRNGIYSIRASDGRGLKRLTVSPFPPGGDFGGGDLPGDYAPNGRRFVFMRVKPLGPGEQVGALFVGKTDGSGVRRITRWGLPNSHDSGYASWSPDGSRILFASERGALFTIRPDGSGLRRIRLRTGGRGYFAFTPSWSPNGHAIVFSLFFEDTEQEDIYKARSDGTVLKPITDSPAFEDMADWGTRPD